MMQPTDPPTWPAPYASLDGDGAITLIPLRGPSGKLYGELDPRTGIITFKRGPGRGESIDLTPTATQED